MQTVINYRKIIALMIFTVLSTAGFSQNTINNYKYVLLPQKFEFLSSTNEYQLNSTAKTLLEQKGFTVYWMNGDMPQAVAANRCSALVADFTQRKALFSTNLTLTLKDCYGNTIFKGKEGRSWEKDFGTAYNEAMNNAFTTLKALPYKYDSTSSGVAQQAAPATQAPQPAAAPGTIAAAATTTAPATAAPAATPPPGAGTPPATAPVTAPATATPASQTSPVLLYAQPIANGYQLVDATPKKVMTLLKTSLQDCFLAEMGDGASHGMVFKNNDQWFFEYYKDGTLVSQKLTIKF